MGLFHCPVGAVGRGGDGCIDCGLCCATNQAERAAATKKVRAHIRATMTRDTRLQIRKIAVCGKGGAGKSTITALLSDIISEMGYECLIIDTDHSNNGLFRKFGLAEEPEPVFDAQTRTLRNAAWMQQDEIRFQDIPESAAAYCGSRRLLSVGKIEDPLQGCACAMSSFAQLLLQKLQPDLRQIVLADQEAGVESFGRGVEAACDTILIVVEPSMESLHLAVKIRDMAQGLGIRRIRAIINKADDPEQAAFMTEALGKNDIRWLGVLPNSRSWRMKNLKGEALLAEAADESAYTLVKNMLDEAQMPYIKR